MDLKITSVHNHGKCNEEYVLLKATADCDVGYFMLADTTYTKKDSVSNKLRHTFWFPNKKIKKGDLVSVWTRTGEDTTTKTDSGTPVHRFYWGLKTSVWNDNGDCAVLLEIETWQLFKAQGG